jgi:hypothetical protein
MAQSSDQRQQLAISRIAGLVLVNAMLFQEVLSQKNASVRPLQDFSRERDLVKALAEHWRYILDEINYHPIFNIAHDLLNCLSADSAANSAILELTNTARRIVNWRASLRHDLAGRIYHRLLAEAKYLGAYYTSIPSSIILAKLALRPDQWTLDWASLKEIGGFRIADLACGTGTLLMAAADAVVDNHIWARRNEAKRASLQELQNTIVTNVLHGYDVLQSAIHLTASTLALRVPDQAIHVTNLTSVPFAEGANELGSLAFLESDTISAASLFSRMPEQVQGTGPARKPVTLPMLDLCIMNPPFTSSRQPNLLFGSVPENQRSGLQKKLQKVVKDRAVPASITAGLGSVFVALGDKYLKEGGRLALVLPRSLTSGVAWAKSRDIINKRYQLEYLIVSHEPGHWNFSENTEISEVLAVAKKSNSPEESNVTCVNLWRNPRTTVEALAVASTLSNCSPPDVEGGQGAFQVSVGDTKYGEALSVPWSVLKKSLWSFPTAFAQSELIRAFFSLLRGQVSLPGRRGSHPIPLTQLSKLGELGPDPRDVYDGFEMTLTATSYPALWGGKGIRSMCQAPNAALEPLSSPRSGRKILRKVTDLWPKAGRVLLTQRPRLNTKSVAAVYMTTNVLADIWWPLRLNAANNDIPDAEKALVLWLNSTLGILILLGHREETQGAWMQFKKPILQGMPALDVFNIGASRRRQLAQALDDLGKQDLLPFPEIARDPVRKQIDDTISDVLGLPPIDSLRETLGREPLFSQTMKSLSFT